ncbi:MAG: ion channel [Pseudomonadota bacterium]
MAQLLLQLTLGGGLIAVATMLQVLAIAAMMLSAPRVSAFLTPLKVARMGLVLALCSLWTVVGQSLGVWAWAFSLLWLDAFPDLEEALYFALSAYTTLGFGDVLPPKEWRILGAIIGANGMLGFGLATAALVEFVGRVRTWPDDLS